MDGMFAQSLRRCLLNEPLCFPSDLAYTGTLAQLLPAYIEESAIVILPTLWRIIETKERKRRYLVFTQESQYGVYAALSLPLESGSYVSVAWFFEASYYNVDNSTWFDPLLGDVSTLSRHREDRSIRNDIVTRKSIYIFIETMLEKHKYPGRACLLRAICENSTSHILHNGLIGDILYLILTPSTSMSEDDIEDCFYEAEYRGLENNCVHYSYNCPINPLDSISLVADNVFR